MAETALRSKGWNLSGEGLAYCTSSDGKKLSTEKALEAAKNTDLREIGEKWLPEEVNRGKCEYVEGPGILQIQKIRNISAPKDHEESQAAPRMLRMTLTDGQQNCNAIEMQRLEKIGLDTPPGTKICIKGTVEVENGFLLLTNNNTVFVGGRVEKLAENWELKKMLAGQSRANVGSEGGPPLFVPFGQRIRDGRGQVQVNKRDNFKSIESNKKDEKTAEELEFEQQRKATIAEAMQAKEESKPKTFGGGQKQIGLDKDISRIVEMGFSAEEANRALRQNDNNVTSAINHLLSGRRDFRDRPSSQNDRNDRRGPQRERDFRDERKDDRRENTRGGRGRGRDREDMMEDAGPSRPSGPATLFDFLETKIKPSDEKGNKQQTSNSSSQNSSSYSRLHDQNSSNQNHRNSDTNSYQQGQRSQGRSERDDKPPYKNYRGGGDSRTQSYNSQERDLQHQKSYNNNNQNHDRTKSSYSNDRGRQGYSGGSNDQRGNSHYNNGQYGGCNEERGGQNQSYNGSSNYSSNSNNQNRAGKPQDRRQDVSYNHQSNRSNSRQSATQNDNRPNSSKSETRKYGQSESRQYGSQSDSRQQYGRNDNRQHSQSDSWQYSSSQNESQPYGQSESRQYSGSHTDSRQQYRQNDRSQYNSDKRSKDFSRGYQDSQSNRQSDQLRNSNQGSNNKENHFQKQQYQNVPPSSPTWKKGDSCLAKYWEDNKFYPAVIQAVYPNLPTCIVLFTEYGNEEEVNLTDVKPNTTPSGQYLPQQQQGRHQQGRQSQQDSHIASMEFRRRPPRTESNKPTQAFYQPPNQRHQ